MYSDIKGFESFVEIEPLNKGWSGDKITTLKLLTVSGFFCASLTLRGSK